MSADCNGCPRARDRCAHRARRVCSHGGNRRRPRLQSAQFARAYAREVCGSCPRLALISGFRAASLARPLQGFVLQIGFTLAENQTSPTTGPATADRFVLSMPNSLGPSAGCSALGATANAPDPATTAFSPPLHPHLHLRNSYTLKSVA